MLIGCGFGRIDGDRVDERIAAQELRAHVAQRRVAGGIGAIGDHDERGALFVRRATIGSALNHGVVDGRPARGPSSASARCTSSGVFVQRVMMRG